ncbi:acetyltransferase [Desulfobulbus rhabdoformis]|uniref:acetyltransferase n=1 Tax=Desulfobulbus rhabdoformis TaxID=34032 RepID=UPI00196698C6|nr:acetyltransferase [Desulfobulbus rhabdoformis]MBM9616593.1 acetyltransferase [Desulfobulbus rhabdoformis]
MEIEKGKSRDYQTLIAIWESSVRATHDFLEQEDLKTLKSLIVEKFFDTVDLYCAKDESCNILGFCGIYEDKVEMLFVAPDIRGKGVGSNLMEYAILKKNITKVDVNEQNKLALGFYEHLGFKVVGRSPLDGQGKPYPLLHMELVGT